MALPLRTHCDRCGLPQWLAPMPAISIRRLECPRCGHRASTQRLKLIRERARYRREPELKLAS
jgi:ribosomal protein S27AE